MKAQWALITLVGILATGCGGKKNDEGEGGKNNLDPTLVYQLFQSSIARDSSPDIDDSGFLQLSRDNNRFAIKLFNQQFEPGKNNSLFSPYSISTALAMTYAGAAGETKSELARALEFNLPEEQLHQGFNRSLLAMEERNLAESSDYAPQEVLVKNAVWPYIEQTPAQPFLDTLAREYGAGIYALDYENEPEASRTAINDQIEEWTNGYISNLLPEDSITIDTRMVITSSIYFFAPWSESFGADSARPRAFHNLDGTTVDVPSMSVETGVYQADTAEAVFGSVPFREWTMEMLFIIPTGDFNAYAQSLTEEKLREGIEQMSFDRGIVQIPKFSLSSNLNLKSSLKALGMEAAFSHNADFSPMDIGGVYIEDVKHKAIIDVNEAGTTAAAATAVLIAQPSIPPRAFTVDKPFIFMIYDRENNTVLFMGHVANFNTQQ